MSNALQATKLEMRKKQEDEERQKQYQPDKQCTSTFFYTPCQIYSVLCLKEEVGC